MKRTEYTRHTKSMPGPGTSGATGTGTKRKTTSSTAEMPAKPWTGSRGQHVRAVVLEAVDILKQEGYIVGRLSDPDLPFDLVGVFDRAVLFVKIVRAKQPVENARGVARYFSGTIRMIQPFWRHDSDNFQFWVFSKVAGLLRYRVYRGGIWNEATRKGPDLKFTVKEITGHQKRSADPLPALSGHAMRPDKVSA